MSSARAGLRPLLSSRPSTSSISLVPSLASHTNHLRHPNTSSPEPLQVTQRRHISRPRTSSSEDYSQQLSPPPGFRMNKVTRPILPVPTRDRKPYPVNTSLAKLNEVYNALLGPGGESALPDDIKWQCVTHKSFDHGLQPYNSKLIFFGRRIVYLHTTLSIVHRPELDPSIKAIPRSPPKPTPTPAISTSSTSTETESSEISIPDSLPAEIPSAEAQSPSLHPLRGTEHLSLPTLTRRSAINGISYSSIGRMVSSTNLFGIARACKLTQVLRWKPVNSKDIHQSGVVKIAEDALYAIIGAIALHRGGDAARRVVEERILVGVMALREAAPGEAVKMSHQ